MVSHNLSKADEADGFTMSCITTKSLATLCCNPLHSLLINRRVPAYDKQISRPNLKHNIASSDDLFFCLLSALCLIKCAPFDTI